jgi:tetratricopeptide (TPR) repeat protein
VKRFAPLLVLLLAAGCASRPPPELPRSPFKDAAFAAPLQRIDPDAIFALSPEMERYLDGPLGAQVRAKGAQAGLIDALYTQGELKLAYDSVLTRTAAETFAERSGNCLSLVIMTAAFAKSVGLSVQYRSVAIDETWSRNGGIYFNLGHVNLTLGRGMTRIRNGRVETRLTTIDFLPPTDVRGRSTEEITEERLVAMYLNNRAGESLADGRVDDAYWWAREAILRDPGFASSYNTLGVVYRRHGDLDDAARLFAGVLRSRPADRLAMSNLTVVLREQGRTAEAAALAARLAALEPDPPFVFFERGLAALRDRDYATARDLFGREIDRTPGYHEFHFWLAVAHVALGEVDKARTQLSLAIEYSTARKDAELYSAKLARLKGAAVH